MSAVAGTSKTDWVLRFSEETDGSAEDCARLILNTIKVYGIDKRRLGAALEAYAGFVMGNRGEP